MHTRVAGLGWRLLGRVGQGKGQVKACTAVSHNCHPLCTPYLEPSDPQCHLCLGVTIPGLGEGSGRAQGPSRPLEAHCRDGPVLAVQERGASIGLGPQHQELLVSAPAWGAWPVVLPVPAARMLEVALPWLTGWQEEDAVTPLGDQGLLNQPRTKGPTFGTSQCREGSQRGPSQGSLVGGRAGVVGWWDASWWLGQAREVQVVMSARRHRTRSPRVS